MVQGLRVRISRLSRTRLGISSREQRSPFVERLEAVIRVRDSRETENREFSFSRQPVSSSPLCSRMLLECCSPSKSVKIVRCHACYYERAREEGGDRSYSLRFIFPIENLLETRVSRWYTDRLRVPKPVDRVVVHACTCAYTR